MRELKISPSITNRDAASLEKYLQDIGKIDLLTPEEEVELAKRIKAGEKEALDKLVRANLRFVVSVAKQYQHQGLSLGDLISEGNDGLIEAAQRFDETKGFKFISYAVWWIRQRILAALNVTGTTIRTPNNIPLINNKIQKYIDAYYSDNMQYPTAEMIAEGCALDLSAVLSFYSRNQVQSMDSLLGDEESGTLHDLIGEVDVGYEKGHSTDLDNEMLASLCRVLLTTRQYEIVGRSYGLRGFKEESLEDIARSFDLTRERARQIKERGISLLKINQPLFDALVTGELTAEMIAAHFKLKGVKKRKSSGEKAEIGSSGQYISPVIQKTKKETANLLLRGFQLRGVEETRSVLKKRANNKLPDDGNRIIPTARLRWIAMGGGKTVMVGKLIEDYLVVQGRLLEKKGLDMSHVYILFVTHRLDVLNRAQQALIQGDEETSPVLSSKFQKKGQVHVIHSASGFRKKDMAGSAAGKYTIICATLQGLGQSNFFDPTSENYLLQQPPHLIVVDEGQNLSGSSRSQTLQELVNNSIHPGGQKPFVLVMTGTPRPETLALTGPPLLFRSLAEHIASPYCPPIRYCVIHTGASTDLSTCIAEMREAIKQCAPSQKRAIIATYKQRIESLRSRFADDTVFVYDMLHRLDMLYQEEGALNGTIVYCKDIATADKIAETINAVLGEGEFFMGEEPTAASYHINTDKEPLQKFAAREIQFLVVARKLGLGQHFPYVTNIVFYNDIDSETITLQRFGRPLGQLQPALYLDYVGAIHRIVGVIDLQQQVAAAYELLSPDEKKTADLSKIRIEHVPLLGTGLGYSEEHTSSLCDFDALIAEYQSILASVDVPKPSGKQIRNDYQAGLFTKDDLSVKNRPVRLAALNTVYGSKPQKYPNFFWLLKGPLGGTRETNSKEYILSLLEGTEYEQKKPYISPEQAKMLYESGGFDGVFGRMRELGPKNKFTIPKGISDVYRMYAEKNNSGESAYYLPETLTGFIRLIVGKKASSLEQLYQYFSGQEVDLTPFMRTETQYRELFDGGYLLEYARKYGLVPENRERGSDVAVFADVVNTVITFQQYPLFAAWYNTTYGQQQGFKMREKLSALAHAIGREAKIEPIKQWILKTEHVLSGEEIVNDALVSGVIDIGQLRNNRYFLEYMRTKSEFYQKQGKCVYLPTTLSDLVRLVAQYYGKEVDAALVNRYTHSMSALRGLFNGKELETKKPAATKSDYDRLRQLNIFPRHIFSSGDTENTMRNNRKVRAVACNEKNEYGFRVHEYVTNLFVVYFGFKNRKEWTALASEEREKYFETLSKI